MLNNLISILPPDIFATKLIGYTDVYIKHIKEDIDYIIDEFIKLCPLYVGNYEFFKNNYVTIKHSGLSKIMEDNRYKKSPLLYGEKFEESPIYNLYLRLYRINNRYEEWSGMIQYNDDFTGERCINNKHPELIKFFRDKNINKIL